MWHPDFEELTQELASSLSCDLGQYDLRHCHYSEAARFKFSARSRASRSRMQRPAQPPAICTSRAPGPVVGMLTSPDSPSAAPARGRRGSTTAARATPGPPPLGTGVAGAGGGWEGGDTR